MSATITLSYFSLKKEEKEKRMSEKRNKLFQPKEGRKRKDIELFQPKEGRKRKENVSNNYIELFSA